jgi:hypothetical protein
MEELIVTTTDELGTVKQDQLMRLMMMMMMMM